MIQNPIQILQNWKLAQQWNLGLPFEWVLSISHYEKAECVDEQETFLHAPFPTSSPWYDIIYTTNNQWDFGKMMEQVRSKHNYLTQTMIHCRVMNISCRWVGHPKYTLWPCDSLRWDKSAYRFCKTTTRPTKRASKMRSDFRCCLMPMDTVCCFVVGRLCLLLYDKMKW